MSKLNLYSLRDGIVQKQAGLNWGFSEGHVSLADAYIALTQEFIRNAPNYFPAHGETIIVEWDDGTKMECLLEGTQEIDGKIYPKQISTKNDKSVLGKYLRDRLKVSMTKLINLSDLDNYGRRDIDVTKINSNHFKFDFSVR